MADAEALVNAFVDKLRRNPKHTKLHAIYKMVITGTGGGVWRMDFKSGGKLLAGDGPADVTFTVPIAELELLVNGGVKGKRLAAAGRIEWEGNEEHLWTLHAVLHK